MPTLLAARSHNAHRRGRLGCYVLAWLLGIPIPILVVVFLLRGCS